MSDLSKRIEDLKKQQEQAKEIFIKCQGGIEALQGMFDEESKDKKDKK